MMFNRMMTVEYIGKLDNLITEYNGKRFRFSRTHRISEIPCVVYDHIKSMNGVWSGDVVPYYIDGRRPEKILIPTDVDKKNRTPSKVRNKKIK